MLFKNAPHKFWNLIASRYAATSINDPVAYEKKLGQIKRYLSADSRVLDIGCATGTQCLDLAKHARQLTGIDISSKLLAIAEQRKAARAVNNVNFILTEIDAEALHEQEFDLIMCFYVLHFVEDIDAMFSRIHSLLKPGGIFVFQAPCMGEKSKIAGSIMRGLGHLGVMPLINLLSNETLQSALTRTGFELLEKIQFGAADTEPCYFAKKSA